MYVVGMDEMPEADDGMDAGDCCTGMGETTDTVMTE